MHLQATCWQTKISFSYGLQIVVLNFSLSRKKDNKKKTLEKEYTVTQCGKRITQKLQYNGTIW